MLLGEFTAELPWGLLLATDDQSRDEIPLWASDDDHTTASATALVIRTVHAAEDSTSVHIFGESSDSIAGQLTFSGTIEIPSGVLRVGDATGDQSIKINCGTGRYVVQVFLDKPSEATCVDIVISKGDG